MSISLTIFATLLSLGATLVEILNLSDKKVTKTKQERLRGYLIVSLTILSGLCVITSYILSVKEDSVDTSNVKLAVKPKIEGIFKVCDINFAMMMSSKWSKSFDEGELISSPEIMRDFLKDSKRENFVDYYYEQNQRVSSYISGIYQLSTYLDTELLKILGNIENSRFFESVERLHNEGFAETDNTFLYESAYFYYEYWLQIQALNDYYLENFNVRDSKLDYDYVGLTFGNLIE